VAALAVHIMSPKARKAIEPAAPASYPKDPADRLIGATALVEGLSLVTVDREIRQSKAPASIW